MNNRSTRLYIRLRPILHSPRLTTLANRHRIQHPMLHHLNPVSLAGFQCGRHFQLAVEDTRRRPGSTVWHLGAALIQIIIGRKPRKQRGTGEFAVKLDNLSGASDTREVQKKLDNLAMLRVWEFCEGKSMSVRACRTLSASFDPNALISSIARLNPDATYGYTATASPTSTTPPDTTELSHKKSSTGPDGLEIVSIIGVAVAAVPLVVAALTIMAKLWQRKQARRANSNIEAVK